MRPAKSVLKRPGSFRWDYHDTLCQQVCRRRRKLWTYDAELEQVTVKPIRMRWRARRPCCSPDAETTLAEPGLTVTGRARDASRDCGWYRSAPKVRTENLHEAGVGVRRRARLLDRFELIRRISDRHPRCSTFTRRKRNAIRARSSCFPSTAGRYRCRSDGSSMSGHRCHRQRSGRWPTACGRAHWTNSSARPICSRPGKPLRHGDRSRPLCIP